MINLNTQKIKLEIFTLLRDEGLTIHGVASANKSPSASMPATQELSPQSLLEDAKSVICYGVEIPRGVLYAPSKNLSLYWRYCNMQYRTLDSISNRLSSHLEQSGCLAAPIYSCFPWRVEHREFWGNLPLVYWAEQAGLGRLSKCGLLVTPQYGTRILLGGAVTTLELAPDNKLENDLCPAKCFNCVNACPPKAIKKTGKIDHNACIRYSSSNPLLHLALSSQAVRERYSFETLLNTVAIDDHGAYLCCECLKACPLNCK